MSATTRRPRALPPAFAGIPAAAFAFFDALARDNTRAWFAEHAETYRACVDRPWRALIAEVAASVSVALPDLDTEVKTGHVLSRLQLQWPRPGATYRTGLRATFAPPEAGRRPGACLFVSLDASGLRAGAEVGSGTAEWERILMDLTTAVKADWAAAPLPPSPPLRLTVAGAEADPDRPAETADRMRAVRRGGSLRWAAFWPAGDALVEARSFAAAIWAALSGTIPLYLRASGVVPASAAPPAPGTAAPLSDSLDAPRAAGSAPVGTPGEPDEGRPRSAEAAAPHAREPIAGPRRVVTGAAAPPSALRRGAQGPGPSARGGWNGPPLPLSLHRALAARAANEGVDLAAFIVFALTRAAAEPSPEPGRDAAGTSSG